MQHIRENESDQAKQTLHATWQRHDSVDEDADEFSTVLTAGVGFAAHTRFYDEEQADEDRREAIDEISEHEDRLVQPELAIYEYLTEGETDTSPEDLRDEVDEDSDEPDFSDLEYLAYATLLEAL